VYRRRPALLTFFAEVLCEYPVGGLVTFISAGDGEKPRRLVNNQEVPIFVEQENTIGKAARSIGFGAGSTVGKTGFKFTPAAD
jgi:hypothetical protein